MHISCRCNSVLRDVSRIRKSPSHVELLHLHGAPGAAAPQASELPLQFPDALLLASSETQYRSGHIPVSPVTLFPMYETGSLSWVSKHLDDEWPLCMSLSLFLREDYYLFN